MPRFAVLWSPSRLDFGSGASLGLDLLRDWLLANCSLTNTCCSLKIAAQ